MREYFSPSTGGFYRDDFHAPEQIPADRVEITENLHATLMQGQAQGKIIVAGANGMPELTDPPGPSVEQAWGNLRATRDNLLAASDKTQYPDYPITDAKRAEWVTYRQALRALPENTIDPLNVDWPVPPA
jgi:hypothetical protein